MKNIIFFLLALCFTLHADDLNLHRNQFSLGLESYHLKRSKQGGTRQHGNPAGLHASYDRLKRYGWYVGANATASWGILKGENASNMDLHSDFTTQWAEGRFGYTFQQKCGMQASFTPYVGGGYLVETNNFISPTPRTIHFKTKFPYVVGGFLFWFHPFENWEIGVNGFMRYPFEPKCYVSHDDNFENFKQLIDEKMHYRAEIPITYRLDCEGKNALTLSPFYESREYGTRINYPIDFTKTKFTFWGATLSLIIRI